MMSRQSKRIKSEPPLAPENFILNAASSNPNSRSLKSLTSRGKGGRLEKTPGDSQWNLDVTSPTVPNIDNPHQTSLPIKPLNDCSCTIVNTNSLKKTVESSLKCGICCHPVRMVATSVALATTISFKCDGDHKFNVDPDPCPTIKGTTKKGSKQMQERASWYQINIEYTLAHLASGCGSTESSLVSSFLSLPGSSHFG